MLERRSKIMTRFLEWWFSKATKKFQKSYDLYGALALFLFVAIPLPVTGVWTASVAANRSYKFVDVDEALPYF